jgi:hypothetical protein
VSLNAAVQGLGRGAASIPDPATARTWQGALVL